MNETYSFNEKRPDDGQVIMIRYPDGREYECCYSKDDGDVEFPDYCFMDVSELINQQIVWYLPVTDEGSQ